MNVNNVLQNLRIQKSEKPYNNLFSQAFLVLLASFILACALESSGLWQAHAHIYHTVFELICIFVAISLFLVVWHIFYRISPVDNLVGFGFLIVAVFDLFHVYYFPELNFYPPGHYDLTVRYWILGRLTEAFILLAATTRQLHFKLNKWVGLVISLAFACGTSFLVLPSTALFPVLLTETGGITTAKIILEYIVIIIFLLSILNLRNNLENKDILTYRYIFVALLLAIPAELCFTAYKTIDSFFMIWGHLLKMAYYYYLFRGTFVSAITYPYEKLEVAESYMSRILNTLPVGVMTLDNDLKVSFVNQKTRELTGSRSKDIVGLPADKIFAKCNRTETQKEALVNQVVRTAKPVKNKLVVVKNCLHGTKVKLKVDVEKLGEWGYLYLMSEAKQEQELENLQLQTQTILSAIGTMVAITDRQNKIIMCNEAFTRTMEMDAGEIKGMTLEDLHFKLRISGTKIPAGDIKGKTHEAYEITLITPRGNKKTLLYYPAIIYNVDGEAIGSIIVASDLTLFKEEQRRLHQQEKLASLGQMAAGIVHEIKNPLTSIKGFSQLCTAKARDDQLKEYVRMIEHAADQANRIVSDFLSFARPAPSYLKECSLNEIIKSMRCILEGLTAKKVAIKYILSREDYKIRADVNQLKQVVLNIVKNAIEAMEQTPHPELTIETGLNKTRKQVFLRITDNGVGMSKEDQLKVGTPFYTTKDNGTGLGLSICYQIIKAHNGNIDIKSRPDKGTSVTIPFPWQEACDKTLPLPG